MSASICGDAPTRMSLRSSGLRLLVHFAKLLLQLRDLFFRGPLELFIGNMH